jgi:hypothetical protein
MLYDREICNSHYETELFRNWMSCTISTLGIECIFYSIAHCITVFNEKKFVLAQMLCYVMLNGRETCNFHSKINLIEGWMSCTIFHSENWVCTS